MKPLAVQTEGAQRLLDALQSIQRGSTPPDPELETILAANHFFLDFYSQVWKA